MFHAILVAIKPALSPDFMIDFANSLATQHKLAIDACSVIDLDRLAPPEPVPIGGDAFKLQRDAMAVAAAREHAAEAISRMATESRTRGIDCCAEVQVGDTVKILAEAVQRCDLLVCGHSPGGDTTERSLLHSILKHCSRPALIVPQTEFSAEGAVLVAYDGSAQAARALASFAESGLANGRAVHIASFEDGSGKAELRAKTAKSFLHRHGISSEVQIGTLIKDAGSHILEDVQRVKADLVVMGAFGRSAVREFFFGSVTRSMLDVLPVPVFLNH
jgi:nucleotide-binding universal stress UspA family protein